MAALAAKSAVALGGDGTGGGGGGGGSLSKTGTPLAGATPLPFEIMEWSGLMCVIVFAP